ncbi:DUF1641 domain-containing protein [Domibacillus iocasae]|uniref:DUF1641 domain-containing protein n=1 Tax=Domibacillus iocasae TaxID=1714016 RepID=A0A1E7DRF5_9BACI|nr:DUF1641 domain-containing protein [Domibacillus iocasae]OES45676.1 hypothetical protein BA724_02370 [Domibacillus iocasae]
MASPITTLKKREWNEEEIKHQSLNKLTDSLTENEEALQKTMAIVRELHDSGILEAAESMLKAKENIAEVALGQVGRKEMTSLINNAMAAAGVLTAVDPEQTKKLLTGVAIGLEDAKEKQDQKVGMFDLVKALKDPDINRAINFGLHFLKGIGKGLKE